MIVLDTHVLLWHVFADRRLGDGALQLIENDDDRHVSAMLSWEIAMLVDKAKIVLEQPLDQWLANAFRLLGVTETVVDGAIAREAGTMVGGIHGDPCDRIMIATARRLGCPLLTADEKILRYAAAGHLKAIDARC